MSDDERMGDYDAGGYDFDNEDPDHIECVPRAGACRRAGKRGWEGRMSGRDSGKEGLRCGGMEG